MTYPARPFLTKDFSIDGGGIDYLGLRWVNLKLIAETLLPHVNNITADIGTFYLGAWIPWKFLSLCKENASLFTESNYKTFREGVEIAIAHAIRDHSPSEDKFGRVRTRIGVDRALPVKQDLTFESIGRSSDNTLYSAPLYGPALHYLDLLQSNAQTEDGRPTAIHLAAEDDDTNIIVEEVEQALKSSGDFDHFGNPLISAISAESVDALGLAGLNPAYYRQSAPEAKGAFAKKLFPEGSGRTRTAQLIVETLRQLGPLDSKLLRAVWHTGLSPDGASHLVLENKTVAAHRTKWSAFQSRQIQRYFLETFLCCFERSIKRIGGGDFDSILESLLKGVADLVEDTQMPSYRTVIYNEIKAALDEKAQSFSESGIAWASKVSVLHSHYDLVEFLDDGEDFARGLVSMARWWIRMGAGKDDPIWQEINCLGGSDRVSAQFLYQWIEDRLDVPLGIFCRELLSGMVFSQHLRIALSRMDGQAQRLRFTLGDSGIVATAKVTNFGAAVPPWMADRLDAFLYLLDDLGMVQCQNDKYTLGDCADAYWGR